MTKDQHDFNSYTFLKKWPSNELVPYTPKIQVVTLFLEFKKKILVLQRARNDLQHKLWGIPGGKLDTNESPENGLSREILEETQLNISGEHLHLLGKVLSKTPSDGEYGLYLYYLNLQKEPQIIINKLEHYEFRWVTIKEFKDLDLLTAQREAFLFVEKNLIKKMESQEE